MTPSTPTPAAMRAAKALIVHRNMHPEHLMNTREAFAEIIDQQTHLPELVEKAEAALELLESEGCHHGDTFKELRSVLEKVKGEK